MTQVAWWCVAILASVLLIGVVFRFMFRLLDNYPPYDH